jgi:hypothetical protein
VFDDGLGVRFVLDESFAANADRAVVRSENTQVALAGDYTCWWIQNAFTNPRFEQEYTESPLSEVQAGTRTIRPNDTEIRTGAYTPRTVEADEDTYLSIHQANLDNGTLLASLTVDVNLGELIAEFTDPNGDDDDPGSYVYPTDGAFQDGAFDLGRFTVYESETAYLFAFEVETLYDAFGSAFSPHFFVVYPSDASIDGARRTQLDDLNPTVEFGSAWNYRVSASGFGANVVDDTGTSLGAPERLVDLNGNGDSLGPEDGVVGAGPRLRRRRAGRRLRGLRVVPGRRGRRRELHVRRCRPGRRRERSLRHRPADAQGRLAGQGTRVQPG